MIHTGWYASRAAQGLGSHTGVGSKGLGSQGVQGVGVRSCINTPPAILDPWPDLDGWKYPAACTTSRDEGHEDIYLSNADRETWLDVFAAVCKRFNWVCHARCQMTNHYHILIETPKVNLAQGMRQLNGVYTQRFNRVQHGSGMYSRGATRPYCSNATVRIESGRARRDGPTCIINAVR